MSMMANKVKVTVSRSSKRQLIGFFSKVSKLTMSPAPLP
jgi:hypothetical protein